ncbi:MULTISPECIES: group II intron reverse transcriptase/maturase [Clostridium]|uniref:RNA-directed DNA polymerase n=1 Tax=Clostridium disporicum TaxID=84024 RepID=A0A174IXZ8_9CLOT|nr:group II intron reverse transcriptase/maturase [Clostridium disporicum]CUO92274.1 Retron-type reverse transcriptase [Clostridium disporicum]
METKSYKISKHIVWEAYKKVKANKGAAGVDNINIEKFEENIKDNLYKLWNRLSSGSYFPPPVRAVEIPKKNGGTRLLGVPTVEDRIAQMVVRMYFEPSVDKVFYKDSYGYRPNKNAIEALGVIRERCWKYDWVLEFDIKGLFDNIDHKLLMKAVKKHTEEKWVILYIERWLKVPFKMSDGRIVERNTGTPQGGVISPVLANLFLHYTFDKWMELHFPQCPWARYADDAVAHCKSKAQAQLLLMKLGKRFQECGLELHPDKTKIIYCKDDFRKQDEEITSFDFLGYTFRPRRAKSKKGKFFINFSPAVSNKATKSMRQVIRNWRIQLKPDKSIIDISNMFNPVIRGWINYYGNFYKSELYKVLRHMNKALVQWARRKYKKLARGRKKAERWLGKLAKNMPKLFAHWQIGILPTTG